MIADIRAEILQRGITGWSVGASGSLSTGDEWVNRYIFCTPKGKGHLLESESTKLQAIYDILFVLNKGSASALPEMIIGQSIKEDANMQQRPIVKDGKLYRELVKDLKTMTNITKRELSSFMHHQLSMSIPSFKAGDIAKILR